MDGKHILLQENKYVQEHSVECNALGSLTHSPYYEQNSAQFNCGEDNEMEQLNISVLSSCSFIDLEDEQLATNLVISNDWHVSTPGQSVEQSEVEASCNHSKSDAVISAHIAVPVAKSSQSACCKIKSRLSELCEDILEDDRNVLTDPRKRGEAVTNIEPSFSGNTSMLTSTGDVIEPGNSASPLDYSDDHFTSVSCASAVNKEKLVISWQSPSMKHKLRHKKVHRLIFCDYD